MSKRPHPVDVRIAKLAARQHGVVSRAQLLDAGLSANQVRVQVRASRLRPLHRGVYLLGSLAGRLEPARAREMAAVLACGPGAVLSHQSAARLLGMRPTEPRPEELHVMTASQIRSRRPGIVHHRTLRLPKGDITTVDRVPTTNAARTMVDLATAVPPRVLEQMVATALRHQLVRARSLRKRLDRSPPSTGITLLRALVSEEAPAFTRSTAEEQLLKLIRASALPAPALNVRVAGYEVDFFWRAERVAVEVDGFAYHRSRRSFEADRRRDSTLAARGIRTVRVTWRQLNDEPYGVVARLAQTLAVTP